MALAQLCLAGAAEARQVKISEPQPGSTVSGSTPFKAKVKGSPRSVSFYVDGKLRSTDRSRPFRFGRRGKLDSSRLSRGVHRLTVEARYRGGKRRSASIRMQVLRVNTVQKTSGTSPGVVWKAPSAGQTVKGILSGSLCEVTVSNARYLRQLRFYVDGREFDRESQAPYNCAWDTRGSSDGAHALKVVAFDTAGNQSTASLTVNVANKSVVVVPPTSPPPPTTPPPTTTTVTPAAGSVLWRGDFESGTLSQWDLVQLPNVDRIRVVSSPVTQGRYAARFEARQGEFTGGDIGSNRSELAVTRYRDREGDERWYRWHTMLAPDFPQGNPDDFCSIMQWKRDDHQNPLPLGMAVRGPNLRVASHGDRYLGPISRGVWHEFLVHAKWSSDPAVGFLEVYMDDQLILPKIHLQNAYKNALGQPIPHYIKQGLYKSDKIPSTYLYHDGMVIGTTRQAVEG